MNADADDVQDARQELEELHRELREVDAELDKQGAPPAQRAHVRLRELGRARTIAAAPPPDVLAGTDEVDLRLALFMAQVKPRGAPISCRRHLPDERPAFTAKFRIAGTKGYITVGEYEDGSLGEVFIRLDKEKIDLSAEGAEDAVRRLMISRNALFDSFFTAVSLLLQVGYPLEALVRKFRYTKFDPSGFTGHPRVPSATSPLDYVFAWLADRYGEQQPAPDATMTAAPASREVVEPLALVVEVKDAAAAGSEE
jgi:hypothetical protein